MVRLAPHTTCRQFLADTLTMPGVEVRISLRRPIVPGPRFMAAACPHGITYWVERIDITTTSNEGHP